MDSFVINPLAIVFLPQIDKKNNYETIACDWFRTEEIIKNLEKRKIDYYLADDIVFI